MTCPTPCRLSDRSSPRPAHKPLHVKLGRKWWGEATFHREAARGLFEMDRPWVHATCTKLLLCILRVQPIHTPLAKGIRAIKQPKRSECHESTGTHVRTHDMPPVHILSCFWSCTPDSPTSKTRERSLHRDLGRRGPPVLSVCQLRVSGWHPC